MHTEHIGDDDGPIEPAPDGAFDEWQAEVLRRLHALHEWQPESMVIEGVVDVARVVDGASRADAIERLDRTQTELESSRDATRVDRTRPSGQGTWPRSSRATVAHTDRSC